MPRGDGLLDVPRMSSSALGDTAVVLQQQHYSNRPTDPPTHGPTCTAAQQDVQQ